MKKKYISPNATVKKIKLSRMIASSNIGIDNTPVNGDQVEGKADFNSDEGDAW